MPVDEAERARLIRDLQERYKTQIAAYARLRRENAKVFTDYARYMADYPYTVARANAIRQRRSAKASAPKRRRKRSAPPPPPPPPPLAPPAPQRRKITPTLVAPLPVAPQRKKITPTLVAPLPPRTDDDIVYPSLVSTSSSVPKRKADFSIDPNIARVFKERYGEKAWNKMTAEERRTLVDWADELALDLKANRQHLKRVLGIRKKKG